MLYTKSTGGYDGPPEVVYKPKPQIHGPSLFREFQTEYLDGIWRVFNDEVFVSGRDGWKVYLEACRRVRK